ncbi:MAG: Rieske (2Fe-2S) protein [Desulfatiglandaceae bacterium]
MNNGRRKFLQWIGSGLLALLALFFGSMVKGRLYRMRSEENPKRLPLDLPQGVTFHEDIIVNRDGNNYITMSARCSHLGCIVDRRQGDKLVCPCHGSKYSINGRVLSGPATYDLARLRHHIDSKEKSLIIERPT